MKLRAATHAGSWYPTNPTTLKQQFNQIAATTRQGTGKIIISPHAGYKYCLSTMVQSYNNLCLSSGSTVFILGPSHHIYFKNKFYLSGFDKLSTPLGNLTVNKRLVHKLLSINDDDAEDGEELFKLMNEDVDEDEHSLEMQFSCISNLIHERGLTNVKVVPVLISHADETHLNKFVEILIKFLKEDKYSVVISTDFAHWGKRFEYMGYVTDKEELINCLEDETEINLLTSRSKMEHLQISINESIRIIDQMGWEILSMNDWEKWVQYLEISGNTICGRIPLSVIVLLLEKLSQIKLNDEKFQYSINWHWINYKQSGLINNLQQSSVSYSSGYVNIKENSA